MRNLLYILKELLEDDKIIKVTINPTKFADYLLRSHNIRLQSSLDIRHMAMMTGSAVGLFEMMCETYLGNYYAEWKVPSSWANEKLKDKELEFAARDSHQAIELFKFFHLKFLQNSPPERISTDIMTIVKEYLNTNYTARFFAK